MAVMIDPGQLRHRIELQSYTDQPDGAGGFVRSWLTIAQIFASVEPVSTSRQIIAGTPQMSGIYQIIIRYRDDVQMDQRFVLEGRLFRIRSVMDIDTSKRFLSCRCEEVSSS